MSSRGRARLTGTASIVFAPQNYIGSLNGSASSGFINQDMLPCVYQDMLRRQDMLIDKAVRHVLVFIFRVSLFVQSLCVNSGFVCVCSVLSGERESVPGTLPRARQGLTTDPAERSCDLCVLASRVYLVYHYVLFMSSSSTAARLSSCSTSSATDGARAVSQHYTSTGAGAVGGSAMAPKRLLTTTTRAATSATPRVPTTKDPARARRK